MNNSSKTYLISDNANKQYATLDTVFAVFYVIYWIQIVIAESCTNFAERTTISFLNPCSFSFPEKYILCLPCFQKFY